MQVGLGLHTSGSQSFRNWDCVSAVTAYGVRVYVCVSALVSTCICACVEVCVFGRECAYISCVRVCELA